MEDNLSISTKFWRLEEPVAVVEQVIKILDKMLEKKRGKIKADTM